MPITENNFTGEELSAALTANPTLVDAVKGVLSTGHKMVVRSEEEENTFKTNFENGIISKKTLEHATHLETATEKLFGVKKKDGEKFYDYYERAATERLAGLTTELETLKKGGSTSDVDKAKIASLEKAIADGTTGFTEKEQALNAKIIKLTIGGEINAGIAGLRSKYQASIPENVTKIVEQNAIAQLESMARPQADGTVAYELDGAIQMNSKTHAPMTAAELLPGLLKDIIDAGIQQPGSGSTPTDPAIPPAEGSKFTGIPAGIDSREKLSVYLSSIGVVADSDEYDTIMEREDVKKLKLR